MIAYNFQIQHMLVPNTKKINRLIITGNGFDLAHDMKTHYNDFMIWYLKRCFTYAQNHAIYEDSLIKIFVSDVSLIRMLHRGGITDVSSFIDHYYEKGFIHILGKNYLEFEGWQNKYKNPFSIEIKSEFILNLVLNCNYSNWVDIENAYYDELKNVLGSDTNIEKEVSVSELNHSLKWLISQLSIYLSTVKCEKYNKRFKDIIYADITKSDFADISIYSSHNFEVGNTLILNFNYTPTIEKYVDTEPNNKLLVNYIHGKLKDDTNKVIFGFGDELDVEYSKFELYKVKGIFEHIKSFWYFKTSNYHNLIRFIDSEDYQVYILGHSCGLSDRTMLNMIFEHENCKSIKIFYHEIGDYNNYTELTQEISRHFKDKQKMRKRIVPFDKSFSMPQITP